METLATIRSDGREQDNVIVLAYSRTAKIYKFASVLVQAVIDVNTPAAKTAAAASWAVTDIITLTAHGFTTGLKGQVTTSDTEPTGISLLTDYFVRVLSDDTISLYDTYAHAIDLTAETGKVNITNIGAGNHTFTPTALAGGTATLQGSIDGVNFFDAEAADNVTADGVLFWNISDVFYPHVRVKYVNTAGSFTADTSLIGKVALG